MYSWTYRLDHLINMDLAVALSLLSSFILLPDLKFAVEAASYMYDYNPDTHLFTPQLVTKYGYPIESHTVLTKDGYFLTLHRIPHGRNATQQRRPPVMVQHGILCSSADWLIIGPDNALGYILADAGFDVWLGNARGNTYSKKHINITAQSRKFWNFSWHEMGVYDVPAAIDYILKETGEEKLYYIGHSMGTTMFYVMMSELPEYNDKVRAMISLSPVAYLNHLTTPLRAFGLTTGPQAFYRVTTFLRIFNFFHTADPFIEFSRDTCRIKFFAKTVCATALYIIGGFGTSQLNMSQIPAILGHTPAGTSTKLILHYAQEIQSGRFCKFDHGNEKNMHFYGTEKPPSYKLENVKVPVSLHFSDHDSLSPRTDVVQLHKELPNPIGYFRVPLRTFNHVDFMWGIDAKTLVYDTVIDILRKY